jgi:epoxyqueuosine reductase
MTSLISNHTVTEALKSQASKLGFDAVGICAASALPENGARLQAWLADRRHGDMGWMETRFDERADPQKLWPEVKSIIMLGLSYAPATDPLAHHTQSDIGVISIYAQGKDYHDVVKSRLKQMGRWLIEQYGGDIKVFVDTAPVMEKPLAAFAGLGWQGKHTNMVSRTHGSWLFLGAIYSTLELTPDVPHKNNCGSCTNCQDICPTKAFPNPYQLDAKRCISYLTIEYKGVIPLEFRKALGNRIYGCDDCLAVCPWNKFASATREIAFAPREALIAPKLLDFVALDDEQFRNLFSGSPIKRIGRDRFIRNVLVALGNTSPRDAQYENVIAAVVRCLADSSGLVRAQALAALKQLQSAVEWVQLAQAFATDPDPLVQLVLAEGSLLPSAQALFQ